MADSMAVLPVKSGLSNWLFDNSRQYLKSCTWLPANKSSHMLSSGSTISQAMVRPEKPVRAGKSLLTQWGQPWGLRNLSFWVSNW